MAQPRQAAAQANAPSDWNTTTVQAAPLLSPDWYRMAHLRLRLRPGVRVSEQMVRGEAWFVLSDPVSGRHLRFNASAWALFKGCDGRSSLDQLWSDLVASTGDDAPSQGETMALVGQAYSANLLQGNLPSDAVALVRAHQHGQKKRKPAINPLSFKLPLWDADRWLSAHAHRVAPLYSRGAAWLIAVLLAAGLCLLLLQGDALGAVLREQWGDGRLLLLVWLAYPPMKALHELAHAFAVKLHGGRVHEVGLSLLALNPVPYVDASAANAFASKTSRMAVAGAGIAVEGLLATGALLLWVLLEPGLARDMALAVVVVGALSSLLVNGNPLLPFDGYHLLCDAAELPNLGSRSQQFWRHGLKKWLLRLPQQRFGHLAPGERPWLIAYAPLAWVFRTGLLVLIATALAQWSATLGLLVLAWGMWLALGRGLWSAWRWLASSAELQGQRLGVAVRSGMLAALVLGLLLGAPLPDRTQASGVVWLPDNAVLRAPIDGELVQLLQTDGQTVAVGQPIALLRNETLVLEHGKAQRQLAQLRIERGLKFENNAAGVAGLDDEIAGLQAQVKHLGEQVASLTLRAAAAGRLVIDASHRPLGRYLSQGDLVGHVLPSGAPMVRALVNNEDIALVRGQAGAITVQLAHGPDQALPATLVAAQPQATTRLPSPALGEGAGGSVPLDHHDAKGLTARAPYFQFDLQLPAGTVAHVGARALVAFGHGHTTPALLAARHLRRGFLRHFEK